MSFQFLSFEKLHENYKVLLKGPMLKKHGVVKIADLSSDRKSQLEGIRKTIKDMRVLSLPDIEKALIVTGAMLAVKESIYQNSSLFNFRNFLNFSTLHANMDRAIGVSPENKLDQTSAKKALEAFKAYPNLMLRSSLQTPTLAITITQEEKAETVEESAPCTPTVTILEPTERSMKEEQSVSLDTTTQELVRLRFMPPVKLDGETKIRLSEEEHRPHDCGCTLRTCNIS